MVYIVINVTEVLGLIPCEGFCIVCGFLQLLWFPPTEIQIGLTGQSNL